MRAHLDRLVEAVVVGVVGVLQPGGARRHVNTPSSRSAQLPDEGVLWQHELLALDYGLGFIDFVLIAWNDLCLVIV